MTGFLGGIAGAALSWVLPAAADLAAALRHVGFAPQTARVVLTAVFALGGAEGAMFLAPILREWLDARRR